MTTEPKTEISPRRQALTQLHDSLPGSENIDGWFNSFTMLTVDAYLSSDRDNVDLAMRQLGHIAATSQAAGEIDIAARATGIMDAVGWLIRRDMAE